MSSDKCANCGHDKEYHIHHLLSQNSEDKGKKDCHFLECKCKKFKSSPNTPKCAKCGYDISELDENGKCPCEFFKSSPNAPKGCGKKVYMHFGVPVCCGEFNLGEICYCQDCITSPNAPKSQILKPTNKDKISTPKNHSQQSRVKDISADTLRGLQPLGCFAKELKEEVHRQHNTIKSQEEFALIVDKLVEKFENKSIDTENKDEICKCGHKRPESIILDENELSVAIWLEYWEQRGKLCWDCFLGRSYKKQGGKKK